MSATFRSPDITTTDNKMTLNNPIGKKTYHLKKTIGTTGKLRKGGNFTLWADNW